MKLETLKKDYRTSISIMVIVICVIILAVTFFTSHANYQISSEGITIINGEVNYTPYDLQILSLYKQKDGVDCKEDICYEEITKMPKVSENYVINQEKSYCYVDFEETHLENIILKTNDKGEHIIGSIPERSKCKIWFDKKVSVN